jgi:hypothetical protein
MMQLWDRGDALHPSDVQSGWRAPVRVSVALPPSAALSPRLVWLVALMLFLLTATNGQPIWWSSAPPSVVLATLILVERGPRRPLDASFSRYNKPITIALCFLLSATALATYTGPDTDPDFVALQALILRGVIPFMIYLSLVGVTLRREDLSFLVASIALGSLVVFVRGVIAFYMEWGFPDLETVLWAR